LIARAVQPAKGTSRGTLFYWKKAGFNIRIKFFRRSVRRAAGWRLIGKGADLLVSSDRRARGNGGSAAARDIRTQAGRHSSLKQLAFGTGDRYRETSGPVFTLSSEPGNGRFFRLDHSYAKEIHMNKIMTAVLSACLLCAVSGAYAQDEMKKDGTTQGGMSHDTMKKDGMSNDAMKKEGTAKEGMAKDGMSHDAMKKDEMKKDEMKKDEMKKDEMKKDEMKKQ
jgi:pentapeptide MXKDX repeat protein